MPTPAHEHAVSELRERPRLLSKLVRRLLDAQLDPRLKVLDATLRFANPGEVRPDLVFLGRRPRWLIVEIQNAIDPDKRRRWLLAASILFNDHGEMGDVLVITASRRVARWAARVASADSELGTRLELRPRVLLLAGGAVQALLDPRHPELALLAAWAMHHRHGPAAKAIVRRALELTERLPEPLRERQMRAILNVLNERMMAFIREVLMDPNKSNESPWFRKLRLDLEAIGEAKGKAEGKQEALLLLLSTRKLPVSSAHRTRIQECTDLDLLDLWIRRATTASSMAEVLEPAARSPRKTAAKQARPASRRRASRT